MLCVEPVHGTEKRKGGREEGRDERKKEEREEVREGRKKERREEEGEAERRREGREGERERESKERKIEEISEPANIYPSLDQILHLHMAFLHPGQSSLPPVPPRLL